MQRKTIARLAALGMMNMGAIVGAQSTEQADPQEVVAGVRTLIDANYVVADLRPAIDAALAAGLAEHRYDGLAADALAERITQDMAAVAHDKHLGMRFDPAESARLTAAGPARDDNEDDPFLRRIAHDHNSGVTRLEVLPGNIRLMSYDGFLWAGDASKAAIDTAMAFLRGGDAIVIDLRHNGGGSPQAVNYLASYFVPPQTKLVTFHLKNDPPTDSVSQQVPGGPIARIPTYVLTSGGSASAAEEFASHVAGFGFGKLVGETTAGAAYRNEFFPVPGGYVISISIGRPELPKGGNWEGKGVAPAIPAPAGKALEAAQADAYATLAATAPAGGDPRYAWLAAAARARLSPATPALALADYAGRYGDRAITVEGDHLTFKRDGGGESAMLPLGGDRFALDADPLTQIRFRQANGTATGMTLERADGRTIDAPRS